MKKLGKSFSVKASKANADKVAREAKKRTESWAKKIKI